MQKPWQAEKVVTKELAIKLIAVECPTLRIDSIHFFGEGWDNTVFIVNDTLVFRFPRREAAVPWLLTEIQCLPLIQNQFALDIPKFMYKGKPSQDYSWPFVGYKLVEGESIDKLHWPRQQRNDNAEILGHALRQLHSLKLGVNTENMASEDLIHRLSPQKRTPQILARLQIIEERNLYPHSLDSLRDFVLRQTFDLTGPKVLAHGDLYAKHLISNNNQIVTGIIDWGDMHVGNPAIDLALAHVFLPIESHPIFLQAYGPVDEAVWLLAYYRGIFSTVTIMDYAYDTEDKDLLQEAEFSLGLLLESQFC